MTSGSLTLGLDTALSGCSAALVGEDGAVLAQRFELIARGHAERLVPMVGDLLADAGVEPGRITAIAVAQGPGSFTGIRVGLAAARAFGLAWGVPCHGVSSLAALALAGHGENAGALGERPFLAAIDASRGQVYAQVFRKAGDTLEALTEPEALTPAEAAALARAHGCALGTGSGAALVHEASGGTLPASAPEWTDAAHVARLSRLPGFAQPPHALYVRPHDARLPGGVLPSGI
ncbi:tRNA (adenosine(37)-N6)-threonylcarbamoyltransferase complex dimerization subunit type 1 TsaB [Pedomonas mirosovicensis]|uniref:tRNA (adenosine(37)-N6)-threonylcarbamoyltransferase complex dimerization subunit type 1 TsaB n=1 Tax=Pedomonas mirosovicensis TaxID=2908641 RepID=UPI0021672269|nr:tRNA (adenosine(37)-N6)-threonylcarbamoyltransferase complex dimerization subunit type 1 TsaB [Pedomonas mirosovicensis]MCH8683992.1 tRNA (adenosine(37)-N6)-threonylcarbamoyltransferase complex dimerization subunit type 1 TsaB [Pedomonas mirosovicensis]